MTTEAKPGPQAIRLSPEAAAKLMRGEGLKREQTTGEKAKKALGSGLGMAAGALALLGMGFMGAEVMDWTDTVKNEDDDLTRDELGKRPFGFTTLDEFLWDKEELPAGTIDADATFGEALSAWWNEGRGNMDELVTKKVAGTPEPLTNQEVQDFETSVDTFQPGLEQVAMADNPAMTAGEAAVSAESDMTEVKKNRKGDKDGDGEDNYSEIQAGTNPFVNEAEYSELVEAQGRDALLVTTNNTKEGVQVEVDKAILNPFDDADEDGVINVVDAKNGHLFVAEDNFDAEGNLIHSDKDSLADVWEDEIGTTANGAGSFNPSFDLEGPDYTEIAGAGASDDVKAELDKQYGEYLAEYIKDNPGTTKEEMKSAKVEEAFIKKMKSEYGG